MDELQEKLDAQRKKQTEIKEKLNSMVSGKDFPDDAALLKWWKEEGFPQPAPSKVQEIKNWSGLSWAKFRKFIETSGSKESLSNV